MEEEEVDSWYEEEKQKVFNEYLDNIEKNKLRVKMRNSFTILKINLVFSYRIKKSFK